MAEYWIVDLEPRLFERWVPTEATPQIDQATVFWRPAGSSAALAIDIPAYFRSVEQQAGWVRRALELP